MHFQEENIIERKAVLSQVRDGLTVGSRLWTKLALGERQPYKVGSPEIEMSHLFSFILFHTHTTGFRLWNKKDDSAFFPKQSCQASQIKWKKHLTTSIKVVHTTCVLNSNSSEAKQYLCMGKTQSSSSKGHRDTKSAVNCKKQWGLINWCHMEQQQCEFKMLIKNKRQRKKNSISSNLA